MPAKLLAMLHLMMALWVTMPVRDKVPVWGRPPRAHHDAPSGPICGASYLASAQVAVVLRHECELLLSHVGVPRSALQFQTR